MQSTNGRGQKDKQPDMQRQTPGGRYWIFVAEWEREQEEVSCGNPTKWWELVGRQGEAGQDDQ
ncbi:hypothetical protein PAAG_08491 [Paracoccidioides lutzii Pb01]|uniref:Uncharacterized protein n=1 Tax=Paracoccidioides lutzii (strain ATCC MYA-826 / Pb01) TaxID=502779 RepID=C1HCK0_PARBA|nr:hypothetical protein PAAG_08491 [Paracoccidioides lutzii Pb01]EEH38764.2 hypothetical protein PAAG_08491 [Paracoccidioides lutzii Pb01]